MYLETSDQFLSRTSETMGDAACLLRFEYSSAYSGINSHFWKFLDSLPCSYKMVLICLQNLLPPYSKISQHLITPLLSSPYWDGYKFSLHEEPIYKRLVLFSLLFLSFSFWWKKDSIFGDVAPLWMDTQTKMQYGNRECAEIYFCLQE